LLTIVNVLTSARKKWEASELNNYIAYRSIQI